MLKIHKLFNIFQSKLYINALRYFVVAGVEHENLLKSLGIIKLVVDIGANKGQFSLVSRRCFPCAKIFAFEPLSKPVELFKKIFDNDNDIILHNFAIGSKQEKATIHISQSEDSSSLLPISKLQNEIFPGTKEVTTTTVEVAPLDCFLTAKDANSPALLKLDVQGFELDALIGCESLLSSFDFIYCECSFVELYSGQKMASDIVEWLYKRDFILKGAYNMSYDDKGKAIQADFMFVKNSE